jgi:uncharacterized SAM-binding protein YcdF (DUF218 family)
VALAFIVGGCALTAYATFRIWQVGSQDGRRHVDAIVVLGTAEYNGRPSPALAARLDHAILLYQEGDAPYLITTGGNQPGDWTTEAEVGRKYAIAHGVPANAILFENTGGTTLQSMKNVRSIMDAHGLKTALFVSDRSHMLRVLRQAQDQGIVGWSSPTETSPDDVGAAWFHAALHELGGMAEYLFSEQDTSVPDLVSSPAASPAPGLAPVPSVSPSPATPTAGT